MAQLKMAERFLEVGGDPSRAASSLAPSLAPSTSQASSQAQARVLFATRSRADPEGQARYPSRHVGAGDGCDVPSGPQHFLLGPLKRCPYFRAVLSFPRARPQRSRPGTGRYHARQGYMAPNYRIEWHQRRSGDHGRSHHLAPWRLALTRIGEQHTRLQQLRPPPTAIEGSVVGSTIARGPQAPRECSARPPPFRQLPWRERPRGHREPSSLQLTPRPVVGGLNYLASSGRPRQPPAIAQARVGQNALGRFAGHIGSGTVAP
jgi:hypothetical protein